MKISVLALTAAAVITGSAASGHANLLLNGDFDGASHTQGNINGRYLDTMTSGQWDVFDTIPYWTKGNGTSGIEIQYNSVIGAHSGNYYVELDSHGGADTNSSMFQNVWLAAGEYILSFMYHARTNEGDNDNGIKALLNGTEINHVSKTLSAMTSPWEQITWTFGVQQAGTYALEFSAYGNDNSLGGFIDSASLTPVPEPATMLLFGTGLAGLAGLSRRRKK